MTTGLDAALLGSVLLDHDEGLCVFDADFSFLWLNATAARLLQRTRAELVGRRLWDEFPEGVGTPVWDAYQRAFATQEPQEVRLWYGPLEGWFRARATPHGDRLVVFFRSVDDEQALAEERTALAEQRARSGARAERLLEVVAALSGAQTLVEVIDVVIERGFGLLGGYGGGVGFVSEDRTHLEVVELRNFGGDVRERWIGRFPLDADIPMMIAARTGEPLFFADRATLDASHPPLAADFGERTEGFAALPLVVDGTVTGALIVMFASPQSFGDEEREFMLTLAGLSAQALERARLAKRASDVALALQQSLLPTRPHVPALDVVPRYIPGTDGVEVGGDWYDVVPLGAGRVAVSIGDVMGHGVEAAALMGQVRAAARAYAQLDLPPAQVVAALDDVVGTIGDGSFATYAYAVYDPADGSLVLASAGHLPPVVVDASGARVVEVPVSPPLGVHARVAVAEHHLELPPGALLVLCTDGVVETRRRNPLEGLAELAEELAAQPHDDLEALADRVLARLLGPDSSDDAALLLVRPRGRHDEAVTGWRSLARDPEVVRAARAGVRELGVGSGLPDAVVDDLELVAAELVTNALRHGRGEPRLRLRVAPGGGTVEVADDSGHLPRRRLAADDDEGGRGLELVAWLSERWGWRPTSTGKVVWAEVGRLEGDHGRA